MIDVAVSELLSRYGPELNLDAQNLPERFVHLHGHSWHSHKDALSNPIELAQRCAELGMKALAVTDHRVGYGLLDVYLSCKNQKIKPILGCELNENELRHVKSAADRKLQGIKSYHLPILAKTLAGYQNLCRILSDAADEGLYITSHGHYEEATLELIRKNGWGKDIAALTGCLAGRMAAILLSDSDPSQAMADAKKWLVELKETFDDVFLEVQFHSHPDQKRLNLLLLRLHKETGVPLVATRDYHYILPDDGHVHDVYVACASGWREGYDSHDYWFCPAQTMVEWIANEPDYVAICDELGINPLSPIVNTALFAETVNIEIPTGKSLMPRFPVPIPHTEGSYLRKLCLESLSLYADKMLKKGIHIPISQYISRLEWELAVITDRGNAGYMLIIWDIVAWAKKNGYILGPGRGSAAGSLVAFLLNITKLDPLTYGLLFQRFLSPDRADEPDIDIDVADVHRGHIIRYIAERWGQDYVAQIGNHMTMAVKSTTQAVGKAMGLSKDEVIAVTKPLPNKWPDQTDLTFHKLQEIVKDEPDPAIIGDIDLDDVEALRRAAENYWTAVNSIEGLGAVIHRVTGAKKSIGIHAGGVAICPFPIRDLVPTTTVPDAAVIHVTQFDMDGLSKLGIVKIDVLGLKNLSVINTALELIRKSGLDVPDLDELPLDGKDVLRLYGIGDVNGIFQGGKAMRKIALKMKPSSFNEVIDLLALARPGPMEAEIEPGETLVDRYINNKLRLFNYEQIDIPHPDLRELLEPTKGVWVYQEQLMIGSGILAGFPPGAQDTLRKATAKKKPELQQALRYVFIYGSAAAVPLIEKRIEELTAAGLELKKLEEWAKAKKEVIAMNTSVPGGLSKGYDQAFLEDLYDQWLKFAGYSFNKSHSAAYALISYWTAFLKALRTAHFICAMLTHDASNAEKTVTNLQDARRSGVPLLPPSINHSGRGFTIAVLDDGRWGIIYGLLGIKDVGEKAVAAVLEARPYDTFHDFCARVNARVANGKVVAALIKAGAFDEFDDNRFALWNCYHFEIRKDPKKKREGYDQYNPESWQPEFGWAWELELMGQFISGHPLQDLPSIVWADVFHNQQVELAGIVLPSHFTEMKDRNQQTMAKGRLDTLEGIQISFKIFARDWAKLQGKIAAGQTVIVKGRKDADWDQLIINHIVAAERRRPRKAKAIAVGAIAPPLIVSDPGDPLQSMMEESTDDVQV